MPVTSEDVAARCGVSRHTVNGVLGKRAHLFAPETRRKVEEAARDLGYRPHAGSRALRSGRSRCIALLCDPDWTRTHLPVQLLHGLISAAESVDMHVAVARVQDLTLPERIPLLRESLMADGLLLNYHQPMPELEQLVAATQLPAVWLNVLRECNAVLPDDRLAGHMAAELLLRLGHHPAWVDPWPQELGQWHNHHSRSERLKGFTQAVTAAGLTPRIITPARRLVDGEEHLWFADILRPSDRPTGIVAVDGEAAGGQAVLGAALAGLAVPRDLSVVVVNGKPARAGVRLSTVQLPWLSIASEAVSMLDRLIQRPQSAQPMRLSAPQLIDSDSSVAPPSAGSPKQTS